MLQITPKGPRRSTRFLVGRVALCVVLFVVMLYLRTRPEYQYFQWMVDLGLAVAAFNVLASSMLAVYWLTEGDDDRHGR